MQKKSYQKKVSPNRSWEDTFSEKAECSPALPQLRMSKFVDSKFSPPWALSTNDHKSSWVLILGVGYQLIFTTRQTSKCRIIKNWESTVQTIHQSNIISPYFHTNDKSHNWVRRISAVRLKICSRVQSAPSRHRAPGRGRWCQYSQVGHRRLSPGWEDRSVMLSESPFTQASWEGVGVGSQMREVGQMKTEMSLGQIAGKEQKHQAGKWSRE